MADDVIDIISRLSFDVVGNDDLQASIDKLQKHANVIEALKGQLANFQKSYENALSPEEQAKYARAIDQTTQSIQAQTQALTKNFNNNKKLQTALKDEIGVIGQLNKQLDDLVKKRSTALSEDEAKKYSVQINNIKAQLKDIFNPGSGSSNGNVLSQILGFGGSGGTIGRQILTGSLIGIGFGGGFGIITRAVSGLIELAEGWDKNTKSIEQFRQELEKANDELQKTIDKQQAQSFSRNTFDFSTQTSEAAVNPIKRAADAVKAQGVINGQVYKAQEDQLQAQQKVRDQEKADIQSQIDIYTKLRDNANVFKGFGSQQDINDALNQIAPTRQDRQTILQQLQARRNKNGGLTIGADPLQVANDNLNKLQTDLKNKQAEIDNATVTDTNTTNEKIYELSENLRKRLYTLEQQGAIERNNIQEAELNNIVIKTAALLDQESELRKKNLAIQLDEANNAVDEEIKLAEKNGTLTTAIEQQYNDVKLQNFKKYNQQVELETIANNERLRQLAIQQTAAANSLSNNQDTRDLARTTTQIGTGASQGSQLDFIQYKHQTDEQNQILLNQFYDYYQQQYDIAAKANADTTELDERFDTDYRILKEQQYQNRLNAFQKYTDDYLAINKKLLLDEQTTLNAQTDTVIKALSDRLEHGLGADSYNYQKQQITIQANITDLRNNQIPTAQSNLSQAETQFNGLDRNNDIVQNNPNASDADKAASQAALAQASTQVDALDDTVKKLGTELNEQENKADQLRRQHIIDEIDDYQKLVDAAVTAFDAINQARQKSLDVEISIRTQQLNQANVLAERGNTSALKQQQELLDKAEQQKELAAKREIEVNEALTVSNSILTITKAAVEGGAGAAFTIAAAVLALGVGIAEATSLAKRTNGTVGFAEGGYTGEGGKYEYAGPVHRGEFVFNQQKTRQYRPLFEALHKGEKLPPIPMLKDFDHPYAYQQQMDKANIKSLEGKMDKLIEAYESTKTEVHTNINERGIAVITDRYKKSEWRRFNA